MKLGINMSKLLINNLDMSNFILWVDAMLMYSYDIHLIYQ